MKNEIPRMPPRPSTIAVAVQPDYRKWSAVRIGMTRAEILALLGPPLTGRERRPIIYLGGANYLMFGFVSYPAIPHWWSMPFMIGFDAEDRVWFRSDPFGGQPLSRTGRPSKPRLITPQNHSRFDHFPRFLDVRWFPCSGVYPLTYDLEVGLSDHRGEKFSAHLDPQVFGQPYALLEFPGAQPGRIRVRGRNAVGVGVWSDYAEFRFDV